MDAMQRNNVYPDATRLTALFEEIKVILAQLSFVSHIYVFGSLARQESDRWSDIDMVVVTRTYQQFWDTWQHLHNVKPVLHHHPFSEVEPIGAHALGNVFVDEAVFHCLDLNFLTTYEHQTPRAMERFGHLEMVYNHPNEVRSSTQDHRHFRQTLTPDEQKIATSLHFTKKNIKRVLRGQPAHDELRKFADSLRILMQVYSFDYQVVGGELGKVAQTYLLIADDVLRNK
jgi:predicted nucleotidyltransferase/metal-responsive CopG/Arc/MetJ family transcriptional regulator